MTPEAMARHPVVRAALALHGATPEDAIDSPEWRRDDRHHYGLVGDPRIPRVDLSRRDAVVLWDVDQSGMPRVAFTIGRTDGRWRTCVTLVHPNLPTTIIAALAGRPVTDLVEMEGAEGMTILTAGIDDDGTRLILDVAGGE